MLMNGEVVERGTHTERLANKGPYYDLYMSQFRREEESETAPANGKAPLSAQPATGD